jgi:hypothetical protein
VEEEVEAKNGEDSTLANVEDANYKEEMTYVDQGESLVIQRTLKTGLPSRFEPHEYWQHRSSSTPRVGATHGRSKTFELNSNLRKGIPMFGTRRSRCNSRRPEVTASRSSKKSSFTSGELETLTTTSSKQVRASSTPFV